MATPAFAESSYLSQVRRLRKMAVDALKLYPLRVRKLRFVNHGENTTFRVVARDGRHYLLRIHRAGYHSAAAIGEELSWLRRLARQNEFRTPSPLSSRRGRVLETVSQASVGARFVDVFHWIDGREFGKALRPSHMFEIGRTLARLHKSTAGVRCRHRRYWDAEGLLGKQAKFGPIDSLWGVSPEDQTTITRARRTLLRRLRSYEKRFPHRQGLVHADLHFGNLLRTHDNGIGVIDFDDSGYGFFAYDLAIPLMSAWSILGVNPRGTRKLPPYRAALIEGYASLAHWDVHDDDILDDMITARRLLMLGWLNSRSDHPQLRKRLKGAVRRTVKHVLSQRSLE